MDTSRIGYEYRYSFSMDDTIISRRCYLIFGEKFIFEIKTNFKIKAKFNDGRATEKSLGSETFSVPFTLSQFIKPYLKFQLCMRLRDYWMTEDAIDDFVRNILDYGGAAAAGGGDHDIVPVAVAIDVCTVQQEGEEVGAALDRAIRAKHLYPLDLCGGLDSPESRFGLVGYHVAYSVREAATVRVVDVREGLRRMNKCPICLRKPAVGAQIATLQCGHAFHYQCAARAMARYNACPTCNQVQEKRDDRKSSPAESKDIVPSMGRYLLKIFTGNFINF